MPKFELITPNPIKIDAGISDETALWTYAGTDQPLFLDTDDGSITCEALGKRAPISNWLVDKNKHVMKLSGDTVEGDFVELTPYCISLPGMMVSTIGVKELQKILSIMEKYQKENNTI